MHCLNAWSRNLHCTSHLRLNMKTFTHFTPDGKTIIIRQNIYTKKRGLNYASKATYLWSIPHYTTADQTSRPWVGPACRTWPLLRNKTGCQQKHRICCIFLAILAAARRNLRAAVEKGEVVQQVEGSTVAIPGRGAVMVGAAAYVTVELSDICAALLPSVPFAVVTERLPVALTGVATPATNQVTLVIFIEFITELKFVDFVTNLLLDVALNSRQCGHAFRGLHTDCSCKDTPEIILSEDEFVSEKYPVLAVLAPSFLGSKDSFRSLKIHEYACNYTVCDVHVYMTIKFNRYVYMYMKSMIIVTHLQVGRAWKALAWVRRTAERWEQDFPDVAELRPPG